MTKLQRPENARSGADTPSSLDARIEKWRTWGGRGSVRAYEVDMGRQLTEALEIMMAARAEIVRLRNGLRSLTEHHHAADEDAPHYSRDECPLCAKVDAILTFGKSEKHGE